MRRLAGGLVLLWTVSCAPLPPPHPPGSETETDQGDVEGGAGGAGSDDNPAPGRLTGLEGIDGARNLDLRILDARGTSTLGGRPMAWTQGAIVPMGQWFLSDSGAEYEIALRGPLLPDGIIRLDGRGAFLAEPALNGKIPRFRVFGGHASFYLPRLPEEGLRVLTPVGPLVTSGAVFSITVSPDFQVLVTCREGSVTLTGTQNAIIIPGQVLVADRLGRGRMYTMTPNEALAFSERWLKVVTEEVTPVVKTVLPRRWAAWTAHPFDREQVRFLALWFREAWMTVGPPVPGPEVWLASLAEEVRPSPWWPDPVAPGLLGELP